MKSFLEKTIFFVRFHAKKIKEHPFVVDNISRGKNHLLVISAKIKSSIPTKQQTRDFWREHHHRMMYIASVFIVASLVINLHARAEIGSVNLYPTNCASDNWQHPEHAAGMPDVSPGGTNFSSDNSAIPTNSPSHMDCSLFQGNIPDGVIPQKFVVHLSWFASTDPIQTSASTDNTATTTASSSTEQIQTDNTATTTASSSTEQIQTDNTATTTASSSTEQIQTDNTATTTASSTDSSTLDASLNDTENNSVDGDMVKDDVVTIPSLDVLPPDEVATSVSTTTDTLSDTVSSTDEQISTATSTDTTTTTQISNQIIGLPANDSSVSDNNGPTMSDLPQDDFLEVEYTLDGITWKTLGTINSSNWKDVSFEIQNTDIKKWDDISNLQIRVSTLLSDENLPTLYIDNVYLEADYQDIPKIIDPPKIMLNDSSLVMDGKSDFGSDETPNFVITDPGLTTSDIQTLVDDNQAKVIQDSQGLIDVPDTATGTASSTNTLDIQKDIIDPAVNSVEQGLQKTTNTVVSFFVPQVAQAADTLSTITDAQVLDVSGLPTDIPVTISDVVVNGVSKQEVSITKPSREFRPGKYTLKISLETAQAIIISQQDFTWGVLTINTDKSIYSPGDISFLQMGVISDLGHTICDADLSLLITGPDGTTYPFASAGGSIVQSGECRGDSYVTVPDYSANFTIPNTTGDYTMVLTATTANGTRSISSHFSVQDHPMFDVVRTGPTRIYPVATYPVSMKITSPSDWTGTIVERVPANFNVSSADFSETDFSTSLDGDDRIISWNVSLSAGTSTTLGYYFKGPMISPEFYLLGPLSFFNTGDDITTATPIFQEGRQWQIADDAPCLGTISGTWNTTNTGGMWTGCTGTNGTPGTSDDVTINSGVTITLGAATPVVNSLTIDGILDTSSVSNYALNTKVLTIDGSGTLNANGSAITLNGTSDTPLTMNGTFNYGTSTVNFTGAHATTRINIPAINYYNVTVNKTGETFSLAGNTTLDPGGTLTVTLGAFGTLAGSNYSLTAGRINIANSGSASFVANASTITLTATSGTAALITKGSSGILTAGSSTIIVNSDASMTLFNGTFTTTNAFNNFTLSPTLSGIRTYTGATSTSAVTFNGNLTLNPSSSGANSLTFTLPGTTIVTGTTTVQGTSSATSVLNTELATYALTSGTMTVATSGTLTAVGGTLITLNGISDTPFVMNGTFNYGTSTVAYRGTHTTTAITASPITYYGLQFNKSGESFLLGGNTTVIGTVDVAGGLLGTSASNYSLTTGNINNVTGSFSPGNSIITLTATSGTLFTKGSGAFTEGGSTVIVTSASGNPTLVSTATTFHALTINAPNATVINQGFPITFDNTTGAKFRIQAGVYNDMGQTISTTSGGTNATLEIDGASSGTAGTLCLGGATTAATNATCDSSATATSSIGMPTFGTYTFDNSSNVMSTVSFLSDASLSSTNIPSAITYGNLKFTPRLVSTGRTYTPQGALNVNGNFTIAPTSGSVALTVNLAGALTVGSAKTLYITPSTATANLDTTASGCSSASCAITAGNIDIESGGTLTGRSATIAISGNWINNGAFTQNTSTLSLTGTSTALVSGTSTTFYNFTIAPPSGVKEVDFATSTAPVFSVANLFTATGHSGALVKLRSVTSGTQWQFQPTGTAAVTYVDVEDSGCQPGSITISPTASLSSGNNGTCWGIVPYLTLSISSPSVGFGNLNSIGARFGTSDGTGSSTDVEGNNITVATYAGLGYTLSVLGGSLTYANHTITPIGNSNISSMPGTEQFGLRAIATGGSGVVQAPYSGSGFGFPASATSTPSIIASEGVGDGIPTIYSVHYIANISSITPAGNYITTLTYVLTGTF